MLMRGNQALIHSTSKMVDPAVREAAIRAAEDQVRKELGDKYELAEIYEIATIDGLTKDLEILDRLDAMFDKCLKRLLVVRRLKSIMSGSFSAPPKRLAATAEVIGMRSVVGVILAALEVSLPIVRLHQPHRMAAYLKHLRGRRKAQGAKFVFCDIGD